MMNKRILLIVGGGIAAYKACELVRLLRKEGASVTCVLTEGGSRFVTAMTLAALSENPVHTTLWDLKNEVEMGHIQLSRSADLVVVCPATADLLARMAAGIADDMASTLLLATDKPVLAVPAMNVRMWQHPATQRNVAVLRGDGITVMQPDDGAMADWRSAGEAAQKIKKDGSGTVPPLQLVENPDILATLCRSDRRPALVVGFAAETNDVLDHARAKLLRKGADWIVANDVATHAMGGDINRLHIVNAEGVDSLPELPKDAAAATLIERIAHAIAASKHA